MNNNLTANNELLGVVTAIAQFQPGKRWRIRFGATDWFADAEQAFNLKPGDAVRIIGQKTATTLMIEPV